MDLTIFHSDNPRFLPLPKNAAKEALGIMILLHRPATEDTLVYSGEVSLYLTPKTVCQLRTVLDELYPVKVAAITPPASIGPTAPAHTSTIDTVPATVIDAQADSRGTDDTHGTGIAWPPLTDEQASALTQSLRDQGTKDVT